MCEWLSWEHAAMLKFKMTFQRQTKNISLMYFNERSQPTISQRWQRERQQQQQQLKAENKNTTEAPKKRINVRVPWGRSVGSLVW